MKKTIILFLFLSFYAAFLITNEFIQQVPVHHPKKESRNTLMQHTGDFLMASMKKTIQGAQALAKIQEKILTISCDLINQEYGKNCSTEVLSSNRDVMKAIDNDMTIVKHHLTVIEQRLQQLH